MSTTLAQKLTKRSASSPINRNSENFSNKSNQVAGEVLITASSKKQVLKLLAPKPGGTLSSPVSQAFFRF